jgi:hypothetical protein
MVLKEESPPRDVRARDGGFVSFRFLTAAFQRNCARWVSARLPHGDTLAFRARVSACCAAAKPPAPAIANLPPPALHPPPLRDALSMQPDRFIFLHTLLEAKRPSPILCRHTRLACIHSAAQAHS